jgi:hypothetical protein
LTKLSLIQITLTAATATAFSQHAWSNLRSLELVYVRAERAVWQQLGRSPQLPALWKLRVSSQTHTHAMLAGLAEGPLLMPVERLDLSVPDDFNIPIDLTPLANHPGRKNWQRLDLHGLKLQPRSLRAFATGEWALTHLDLGSCRLETAAVQAFAEQAYLPKLTHLSLRNNTLSATNVQLLATSAWLPQLTSLNLAGTGLSTRGLSAWATAPVQRLQHLDLSNQDWSSERLRGFTRGQHWDALHTLLLADCELDEEALELLAGTRLPALRRLSLASNYLSVKALRHLIASPFFVQLEWLELDTRGLRHTWAKDLANALEANPHLHIYLQSQPSKKSQSILGPWLARGRIGW